MKIQKCVLCSGKDFKLKYHLDNFDILECKVCGLICRSKKFSETKLRRLFSENFFRKIQKEYFKPCLNKFERNNYRFLDFQKRFQQLKKLKPRKQNRLIDLGCATGAFLYICQQNNWQAFGIDISSYAVKLARQKHQLNARTCAIENFRIPKQKFDIATAWEVIPNFENPDIAFKKISQLLKPKGILALQLTVTDSLIYFISHLIYSLSLGKINMFIQKGYPIHHSHHFTRKTLKKFLHKYQFKIIQEENIEINFRYSRLPKIFLPMLSLIGYISKKLQITTQYRVFCIKV